MTGGRAPDSSVVSRSLFRSKQVEDGGEAKDFQLDGALLRVAQSRAEGVLPVLLGRGPGGGGGGGEGQQNGVHGLPRPSDQ